MNFRNFVYNLHSSPIYSEEPYDDDDRKASVKYNM